MSTTVTVIQFLLNDILSFHAELEKIFVMGKGIHDQGLLESAVHAPFQTFGGCDLYPSIYEKAACLCYGLAKNHPFCDGNKRTALHSMLVYLGVNNIRLHYDINEVETVILAVTDGSMTATKLSEWLQQHSNTENDETDK